VKTGLVNTGLANTGLANTGLSFTLQVHLLTELTSAVPYGVTGYRSDCRNSPYNGIMTIDHSLGQAGNNVAWFLLDRSSVSSNAFIAAESLNDLSYRFDRFGLWTGFGAASNAASKFQIGVCDAVSPTGEFAIGFFVSGTPRCRTLRLYLIYPLFRIPRLDENAENLIYHTKVKFCMREIIDGAGFASMSTLVYKLNLT
jgi:hypothetical protein